MRRTSSSGDQPLLSPHILLDPDPHTWQPRSVDAAAPEQFKHAFQQTRSLLGLPPSGVVIATGHQAGIWHPGILAKDIAISAWESATPIHFVADHDANDAGLIQYPTGSGTNLKRLSWRAASLIEGMPTGHRPAEAPGRLPYDAPPALKRVREILENHQNAENLATQYAHAAAELAEPWTGTIPRFSVSSLLQLPVGQLLIERMKQDPVTAATTYNQALAVFGRVGRPLKIHGAHTELPVWADSSQGRRRLYADQIDDVETLRPRALLASALMRLSGCDVFVHGTGGQTYDPAMERWLHDWIPPDVSRMLALRVTASANLYLPLDAPPPLRPVEDLNRVINNPGATPGQRLHPEKQQHLDNINTAERRSSQRKRAFQDMKRWLSEHQDTKRIEQIQHDMAHNTIDASAARVAYARDWPFPLYPEHMISELKTSIVQACSGASTIQSFS